MVALKNKVSLAKLLRIWPRIREKYKKVGLEKFQSPIFDILTIFLKFLAKIVLNCGQYLGPILYYKKAERERPYIREPPSVTSHMKN